jgi:hypothetical protein
LGAIYLKNKRKKFSFLYGPPASHLAHQAMLARPASTPTSPLAHALARPWQHLPVVWPSLASDGV